MNKKYIKQCAYTLACLAAAYIGYRWDQARKLDNYFIDQICLDAELQAQKGQRLLDGPLFYQTREEMKDAGYNPYEIQQIIFKGYDKALKNEKKFENLQALIKETQ